MTTPVPDSPRPDSIQPAYRYRASLVRVVDADTLVLSVDLGFRVHLQVPVRLRGWDAPELRTPEGRAAADFVRKVCERGEHLLVETFRDQRSFARWVGDVYVDGRRLTDLLAAAGHGRPLK